MLETKDFLHTELKKCQDWEKDQSGLWFWERLGRLPFKLLDKWTPAFLQQKFAVILDELGQYIQSGGRYLSSVSSVKSYYSHLDNVTDLQDAAMLPIAEMDQAVLTLTKKRKKLAALQGASTGIGGLFTITIDIPLLLGLQLKTLQDIAICYGFNPNDGQERIFIVKCLQFVSADIVGKKAILEQLSAFDSEETETRRQVVSEIQGWREVVLAYRDQIGWKKLFQMIPIAGLLFGAYVNRSAIKEIAEAGMMLYRKRRILERLEGEIIEPALINESK